MVLCEKTGLRELALFAGAGGGILGGMLCGWRTIAAVEIKDYPRRVLLQRQADGILPKFPIWDDVCTFDGKPWMGKVDIVTGGFPCQDISSAGKGKGITGKRSGLWKEMARIIGEVRPRYAFMENSPLLVSRGLTTVLGDLAEMGYDAKWGVIGACDAGAKHERKRVWVLANSSKVRELFNRDSRCRNNTISNNTEQRTQKRVGPIERCKLLGKPKLVAGKLEKIRSSADKELTFEGCYWKAEPNVDRMAYGVANGVDRIAAIGNGQLPAVVGLAWQILSER